MDTLAGDTCQLSKICLPPASIRDYSNSLGKNLLLGSKFSPFKVDLYFEGVWCTAGTKKECF